MGADVISVVTKLSGVRNQGVWREKKRNNSYPDSSSINHDLNQSYHKRRGFIRGTETGCGSQYETQT